MATATQTQPPTPKSNRSPRRASAPQGPQISFLVFEDNAGAHRWSALDGAGTRLAQSEPYTTPEAALAAAELIRGTAGAAEIDSGAADAQ